MLLVLAGGNADLYRWALVAEYRTVRVSSFFPVLGKDVCGSKYNGRVGHEWLPSVSLAWCASVRGSHWGASARPYAAWRLQEASLWATRDFSRRGWSQAPRMWHGDVSPML